MTTNLRERVAWALVGALGLLVVAALTGVVSGGPLDPDAPPGSTLRPLSDIPPSWSEALPSNDGASGPDPPAGCNSTRFKCVLGNVAVLDKETGLVWDRSPFNWFGGPVTWSHAWISCQAAFIGQPNRSGWRLPSIEELQTLVSSQISGPWLPTGHPFVGVQTDDSYWSSTSVDANTVRVMTFTGNSGPDTRDGFNTNHAWCVRGGRGEDALP